jgi:hypothetical protein
MPAGLHFGEWIEGFHNLLGENQFSWVMVGFISISVAPLESQNMFLDFWVGYGCS